ncbi:IucA/IucC family protein [Streptomyces sp. A0592]|uniref:IucA/IucC family protein n=1 Tax=Streptomyces sp. A0592 TaxID=2563099 RepID=UPI00109EA07B|nr:IucA/IucC family protein [Streptomyces sp. A0592]THA85155.1 iron transporter [Streptomyces sp. A0592]
MPDPHQSTPTTPITPAAPLRPNPLPDNPASATSPPPAAPEGPDQPQPLPDPARTAAPRPEPEAAAPARPSPVPDPAPAAAAEPVSEPARPGLPPTPAAATGAPAPPAAATPRSAAHPQVADPAPGESDPQAPSAEPAPGHRSAAADSDGNTAEHPLAPEATPGEPFPQPAAAGAGTTATVPRQKDGTPRARTGRPDFIRPVPTAGPDPLDHPDPALAAEAAAVENLLRCWVRESGLHRPDGPTGSPLRIPLPASGTAALVAVRHWSHTGWHRFGPARLEGTAATAPCLDAVTLAALIAREGASESRGSADLVGRVADSVRRTTEFIADRRERPTAPAPACVDRFLTAEQSLLLGHPLQPDPKSREGLSEAEARRYSPELHGSFPLHWFAVAPSALATESAWTERGRPVTAPQLLGRLAPGLPLPAGTTPLPLHPWQARELLQRPAVTALRDAGLLHDLGPHGEAWHPTSSVRTVHRPGAPAMLKLSLGLRITNSRRENLRKELHRGVEVHRLLRTGLTEQWQSAHPGFDIVRDPAWVAVDAPDGTPVPGLDALLRHNPFRSGDDAVCIAALTSPGPWPGRTTMSSRLAEIVSGLASATGHSTSAVAAEWFLRYLDHVVLPVLAFDALAGIALEAHQQNTLVLLDPVGWPTGGRYRDNQGYYFRESRRAELEQRLPGIGARSDTFVSDSVTDERFAYYLGINNVLGLIGSFGSQRLADERVLLAAFRRFLAKAAGLGPLPTRLLDSPTLRCKANLLTRLGGLDELVGPVDTQSVYVTITNPLHD